MQPVCFHIGGFQVHWFGVMLALGFMAGLANWVWLGRNEGRGVNYCSDLLFWVMLSGIVGARVAYVLSDWRHFLAAPMTIVRIDQGGLVFYGGLVAAIAAIAVFAKTRGEKVRSVFDFAVTAVPLAHAFGRVGCFLNGCCFGKPADLWCAVRFPHGSAAWWAHLHARLLPATAADDRTPSLPVHPVQIYESLYSLVLYGLLVYLYKRRKPRGVVAAAYVIAYPAGRFLLEFLRGDERLLRDATRLTAAQITSLALILLGGGLLAVSGRARRDPDPVNRDGA